MSIIISAIWMLIGIIIAMRSLSWYFIYMFLSWAIFTIIEAKKTTGGKGVNRPVEKRDEPF